MSLVDAFDFPVAVNVIAVAVRKRVEAADWREIAEGFGIAKLDYASRCRANVRRKVESAVIVN